MILGIDTRPLKFAQTGLKTYLSELVQEWNRSNNFNHSNLSDLNIVLLAPTSSIYNGNNKLRKIWEHFCFMWWKQIRLPQLAAKNNCTHLFCADFFVPYKKTWKGRTLKTIAVLHDAFFWESPEHYNTLWLKLFHLIGVPAAKKADLIVVPTAYAQQRILEFEKFDPSKIVVVYEAAKTLPLVTNPASILETIHPALVGQSYFLHVGVLEKRKNITSLLEAFALVLKNHPDFKLVLVGNTPVKEKLNDAPQIEETITRLQLGNSIIRLGYLDAEKLASIYQRAFAYVFPSLNEGFGLPVLEAFHAGLPIICANNSALPEVAGDAALYFDPTDINALSFYMEELISKPDLQKELIQKGKQRISQFAWSKAAAEIQAAMEVL